MTSSFDALAKNILNTRQNIIGLTEQDYDATPIIVTANARVRFKKTITIERRTVSSGVLIWDHSDQGNWDEENWAEDSPGFILGHPDYGKLGSAKLGATLSAWVTEQVIVECNYNDNAWATMINELEPIWGYLAYGSGTVLDNAVALDVEIDRNDDLNTIPGTNSFQLQFTIDETEGNGNTFREYGLAKADVGDISSTLNYAPVEKNSLVYVLAVINVVLNNL